MAFPSQCLACFQVLHCVRFFPQTTLLISPTYQIICDSSQKRTVQNWELLSLSAALGWSSFPSCFAQLGHYFSSKSKHLLISWLQSPSPVILEPPKIKSLQSYDQLRQHIKKQRHYFAVKSLSSQSYGFSSSHVWMWELDYKESWALKNWCFWTVMLENTLESLLDCKEVKPVNPQEK